MGLNLSGAMRGLGTAVADIGKTGYESEIMRMREENLARLRGEITKDLQTHQGGILSAAAAEQRAGDVDLANLNSSNRVAEEEYKSTGKANREPIAYAVNGRPFTREEVQKLERENPEAIKGLMWVDPETRSKINYYDANADFARSGKSRGADADGKAQKRADAISMQISKMAGEDIDKANIATLLADKWDPSASSGQIVTGSVKEAGAILDNARAQAMKEAEEKKSVFSSRKSEFPGTGGDVDAFVEKRTQEIAMDKVSDLLSGNQEKEEKPDPLAAALAREQSRKGAPPPEAEPVVQPGGAGQTKTGPVATPGILSRRPAFTTPNAERMAAGRDAQNQKAREAADQTTAERPVEAKPQRDPERERLAAVAPQLKGKIARNAQMTSQEMTDYKKAVDLGLIDAPILRRN